MASSRKYGRWQTVEALGEGGQGHVFKVKDTTEVETGPWVLKRLKNVDSAQRRKRFQDEVEALEKLSHPNILRLVDYDLQDDTPYYVAEYCETGSLEKIGAQRFLGSMTEALHVLLPVLDALVAAHQKGIIHRDLKPGNILLRGDGTPVIGDFGICHIEEGNRITFSEEHVGSVNYVAPEMESGMKGLGGPSDQTDVYSLGKVLYWMLSGGHIFAREDHRAGGNSLVARLRDQRFEHVHMLLDRVVLRDPGARLRSSRLRKELEMVESLVEGNYAPLKPSVGIRCRFCGIGQYERYAEYSRNNPPDPDDYKAAYAQRSSKQRLHEIGFKYDFADVRVLRCGHCGHIQAFHSLSIRDQDWWNR